jgi:Na+-driven multidrug efflux pump
MLNDVWFHEAINLVFLGSAGRNKFCGKSFPATLMNGFGEKTVAAITTAYRVDSVILLPIVNFGSGIATVVAQNVGAGKKERAKKVLKTGVIMMIIISLCLTGVVLLAGENLIAMFGLTPESVVIGKSFFQSIATCYVIYGLAMAVRGYLEGTGDMLFSGIAGIISLGVRIGASYAGAAFFGNMIIAYAESFFMGSSISIYVVWYIRKTI